MKEKITEILQNNKMYASRAIKKYPEIMQWVRENCDPETLNMSELYQINTAYYDRKIKCPEGKNYQIDYTFADMKFCSLRDNCECNRKQFNAQNKITNLARRGVEHSSKCPKVKANIDNAHQEKYGVKRASQRQDYIQKGIEINEQNRPELKIIHNKELLQEHLMLYSVNELSDLLGFNRSTIFKAANKLGIDKRKRKKVISQYEVEINEWLKNYDINYIWGDREVLKPKELDFYFPEHKFAIEFQGDYHHMNPAIYEASDYNQRTGYTAEQQWQNDLKKKIMCDNLGITLKPIWMKDWLENSINIKEQILLELEQRSTSVREK